MARRKDMPKPPRSGGKAAPYDYAEGGEDSDFLPALREIKTASDLATAGADLTSMRVVAVCELVKQGVPIPVAAGAVGCGKHWKEWMRTARQHKAAGKEPGFGEGESKYLFFLEQLDTARCAFEAQMVCSIQTAAVMDWKAAAYLLERRASKRWHLQSKLEITNEAKSKLEITAMSTEKLIAIARGLLPAEDIKETKALPADIEDGVLLDDEMGSDD